jgi:hypothetical protein
MKLFDTVALEEVELTEADSRPVIDTDDSLDAIFDEYMEMEDMAEGADTYYSIKNALGDNPSEQAQQIADITIESIRARLNIPATSVSLENDDEGKDEKDEDGFFTKVWKAIKNFFAKIWSWVKGLFSKKKDNVEKIKKKAEQDIDTLKDLIEQSNGHQDPDVRRIILDRIAEKSASQTSAIKKFDRFGKKLSHKDIHDLFHDLKVNSEALATIGQALPIFIKTVLSDADFKSCSNFQEFHDAVNILTKSFDEKAQASQNLNAVIGNLKSDDSLGSIIGKKFTNGKVEYISHGLKILSSFTRFKTLVYYKVDHISLNTALYHPHQPITLNFGKNPPTAEYGEDFSSQGALHELIKICEEVVTNLNKFKIFMDGLASHLQNAKVQIDAFQDQIDHLEGSKVFKESPPEVKHKLINMLKFIVSYFSKHHLCITQYSVVFIQTYDDIQNLVYEIMKIHEHAIDTVKNNRG